MEQNLSAPELETSSDHAVTKGIRYVELDALSNEHPFPSATFVIPAKVLSAPETEGSAKPPVLQESFGTGCGVTQTLLELTELPIRDPIGVEWSAIGPLKVVFRKDFIDDAVDVDHGGPPWAHEFAPVMNDELNRSNLTRSSSDFILFLHAMCLIHEKI